MLLVQRTARQGSLLLASYPICLALPDSAWPCSRIGVQSELPHFAANVNSNTERRRNALVAKNTALEDWTVHEDSRISGQRDFSPLRRTDAARTHGDFGGGRQKSRQRTRHASRGGEGADSCGRAR